MPTHEPGCSCGRGPSVAQGKWYGVRSYLHLFYEDCTRASPDGDRDGSSSHGAWTPLIWKVRHPKTPASLRNTPPCPHLAWGASCHGIQGHREAGADLEPCTPVPR